MVPVPSPEALGRPISDHLEAVLRPCHDGADRLVLFRDAGSSFAWPVPVPLRTLRIGTVSRNRGIFWSRYS